MNALDCASMMVSRHGTAWRGVGWGVWRRRGQRSLGAAWHDMARQASLETRDGGPPAGTAVPPGGGLDGGVPAPALVIPEFPFYSVGPGT
jgi:hypothetical protein